MFLPLILISLSISEQFRENAPLEGGGGRNSCCVLLDFWIELLYCQKYPNIRVYYSLFGISKKNAKQNTTKKYIETNYRYMKKAFSEEKEFLEKNCKKSLRVI